jgi:hypothetical protein
VDGLFMGAGQDLSGLQVQPTPDLRGLPFET